jgi:hypothetical protein
VMGPDALIKQKIKQTRFRCGRPEQRLIHPLAGCVSRESGPLSRPVLLAPSAGRATKRACPPRTRWCLQPPLWRGTTRLRCWASTQPLLWMGPTLRVGGPGAQPGRGALWAATAGAAVCAAPCPCMPAVHARKDAQNKSNSTGLTGQRITAALAVETVFFTLTAPLHSAR